MVDSSFFEESSEQSKCKARIVSKYFWAWASVVKAAAKNADNRIAYVDLFAGPGRYKDGTKSTPLLVLEKAVQDPDMRKMLVSIFNDADSANTSSLQSQIDAVPGIKKLKYPPIIWTREVGDRIAEHFNRMSLVPTLFFVDPWGYKGLSLNLIHSVLKDWGCDCIFFFNYNRINMGVSNDLVREHMEVLFGADADSVREKLVGLSPYDRETTVVEELSQALKRMGAEYVLPFRFKDETGSRTSHYLVLASKHVRGYEIMKEIMAKESSEATQGVPSFEYIAASTLQPLLFDLVRPLDELEGMLLNQFRGQTLTMRDIYDAHHVGKPYIKRNYKQILAKMEAAGKIIASPPASNRPKRSGEVTFADHVRVTIPRKKRAPNGI